MDGFLVQGDHPSGVKSRRLGVISIGSTRSRQDLAPLHLRLIVPTPTPTRTLPLPLHDLHPRKNDRAVSHTRNPEEEEESE